MGRLLPGEAPHLLEWEMALRVLEELGFSIQRQRVFQVTDAQGQILRFDLVRAARRKNFLKTSISPGLEIS